MISKKKLPQEIQQYWDNKASNMNIPVNQRKVAEAIAIRELTQAQEIYGAELWQNSQLISDLTHQILSQLPFSQQSEKF